MAMPAGSASSSDLQWRKWREKRAGSETVLTKLSELMFIDVLRRYIETLPPQNTGWLAACGLLVGNALSLIHDFSRRATGR